MASFWFIKNTRFIGSREPTSCVYLITRLVLGKHGEHINNKGGTDEGQEASQVRFHERFMA